MKLTRSIILLAVLSSWACSDTPAANNDTPCPSGEARSPVSGECETTATVASPDTGVAHDDTGGAPDTGSPTPDMASTPADVGNPVDQGNTKPDMGMQPANFIRFVAIGDQGTGSDMQRQVGATMGTVCESLGGCDFGLLLGDNFYNTGVSSVDDMLFMTSFEIPYGGLGFPFYAILGNHDLGGDGIGISLDQNKATYQIDYGMVNPDWIMPARYYEFTQGPVHFVGLDTTAIFFGNDADQRQDVPQMIANAGGLWKIAFGHHPYYSNGPHGNAGEYEGLPFVPIANGENVKSFMEDRICGNVDLYICGHDHSRQDLVADCNGTQFIVSGAGAKTTDLGGSNATHFESLDEGFLLVEATDTALTIRFYDWNGTMNHERTITR